MLQEARLEQPCWDLAFWGPTFHFLLTLPFHELSSRIVVSLFGNLMSYF